MYLVLDHKCSDIIDRGFSSTQIKMRYKLKPIRRIVIEEILELFGFGIFTQNDHAYRIATKLLPVFLPQVENNNF